MRVFSFFLLPITLSLSISNASASCTKHIYNSSQANWTVAVQVYNGNVQLVNCTNDTENPCLIAPNTSVEIDYTSGNGKAPEGNFMIKDSKSITGNFSFSTDKDATDCDYISQKYDTVPVTLNAPSHGDIQITGNSWQK